MSFGSPADIIPFTRFVEYRQRRHRIATAHATVARSASTDGGVRPGNRRDGGESHKIEVIGITSDTKLNDSDAFSAIGSTTQGKAT